MNHSAWLISCNCHIHLRCQRHSFFSVVKHVTFTWQQRSLLWSLITSASKNTRRLCQHRRDTLSPSWYLLIFLHFNKLCWCGCLKQMWKTRTVAEMKAIRTLTDIWKLPSVLQYYWKFTQSCLYCFYYGLFSSGCCYCGLEKEVIKLLCLVWSVREVQVRGLQAKAVFLALELLILTPLRATGKSIFFFSWLQKLFFFAHDDSTNIVINYLQDSGSYFVKTGASYRTRRKGSRSAWVLLLEYFSVANIGECNISRLLLSSITVLKDLCVSHGLQMGLDWRMAEGWVIFIQEDQAGFGRSANLSYPSDICFSYSLCCFSSCRRSALGVRHQEL